MRSVDVESNGVVRARAEPLQRNQRRTRTERRDELSSFNLKKLALPLDGCWPKNY